MLNNFNKHNQFKTDIELFKRADPHLSSLAKLQYQHSSDWWEDIHHDEAGIYILTGGRQIGKSTSCKLFIKNCLEQGLFTAEQMLYLACDEIFDAKQLSTILRTFLDKVIDSRFLLVIDEVTYVKDWDRVIKALADEGSFTNGICLLTGSDTVILKEAAMRFPGRRGTAPKTDFHLYPLSFSQYVKLIENTDKINHLDESILPKHFQNYLQCGGYLRAINDMAAHKRILESTYLTYEQWIRGDFLRRGKNEENLLAIIQSLLTIGVGQISYSSLTQKVGLVSKETLMDYCRLLERMDILINLQAFDQNKKQGFPRKDRKFHFTDPFIYRTLVRWLSREGYLQAEVLDSTIIEATVASHCKRMARTFYFKGQGEIDIVWLPENTIQAVEVKWAEQIRATDLKMLKHFKNALILGKRSVQAEFEGVKHQAVYSFLLNLNT